MTQERETHSNRRVFLKAAGTAGVTAFAGCAGGGDGSSSTEETTAQSEGTDATETATEEASTQTQSPGGKLTAGISANKIETLDPAMIDNEEGIQVATNVYNALLRYDEDLNVVGDLASEWTWTGETTVEFALREGVTFHDGSEMTAEDVKFSLERVLDEDTGSPWREKLKTINAVKAEDAHTLVLELEKPYAPLESYLVRRNMGGCVVSKKAVEGGSDPASEPIGTGPFQVGEWKQGATLTLETFEDYWEGDQSTLDSATLQMIPDETTLTTALEAKDVDIISTVPNQALGRLRQKQSVNLYSTEGLNVRYIGFNTRDDRVFSDKKVRQAASLALSRENIVKVLGSDVFSQNKTPVPQALKWAQPDQVPMQSQDAAKAEKLLEEAGATGESITIKVWKSQSWKKIANTARDMLNQVGFDAEVKVFEWGTFWDHVTKAGDFDAFVLGWTGLTDPDGYLYSQFHTGGSWNWMDYSNEEVDELLEKGRTATTQEERAEHYYEAQRIISEDAVYANIATQKVYQAAQSYVKGYKLYPTGSFRFTGVSVDK